MARQSTPQALSQTPQPQAQTSTPAQERVYRNTQEIDSDLFKLSLAKMLKNHAMDGSDPFWVEHEHTHVFRTYDSVGEAQKYSSPVGGHFHEITVTQDTPGSVPLISVGPALKWVVSRDGRRQKKIAVEIAEDHHAHSAQYLRSDKIKQSEISPEFAKLQGVLAAKVPPPVDGVL